MQDRAVRPIVMTMGRRKVIRPVVVTTGQRKCSKLSTCPNQSARAIGKKHTVAQRKQKACCKKPGTKRAAATSKMTMTDVGKENRKEELGK